MVDVLRNAGRPEQAYEFIQRMPIEPTAAAWGALLSACRVHRNMELAKVAAKKLFEIEPGDWSSDVCSSDLTNPTFKQLGSFDRFAHKRSRKITINKPSQKGGCLCNFIPFLKKLTPFVSEQGFDFS